MTTLDTSNASLVNTWILRLMLSDNDALLKFYDPDIGFRDDDIARFLGLPSYEYDTRPSLKQFKALLRQKLSGCAKNATLDAQLARNLDLLSKGLALNETQRMLLAFALLKEVHEALGDSFNRVKTHHEGQLVSMLSAVLNINRQDIKQALSPSGVLRRAGLINLAYNSIHEHVDIEIMNQLKDAMLADNADEKELLAHFLLPSEPGSLRLENYPHIAEDIAIITRLLASALRKQTKGINILLYGPPGTGKTELARLLAHEVHASLFEVRTQDDEGDPEGSMGRLMGYRLSQSLLSCNENSLILFDEVEDIFPTRSFSFFGIETTSARHKGWTNKALEENPVPTIWISNTIKHFDPSILRRFDYALEVPVPPRSVRLAIARDRLQGTPVSEAFLARLAEHEQLSAAQIAKSAKVVRNLGYEDPEEAEQTIERVLERSIRAMGQKPLPRKHPETTAYSLEYLNINANAASLVEGLKRSGRGNLCFYGPPGTGKTAFARHIAEQLDKPLLCRRASDILSMWVGGTEQNIAAMFARARDEDAVLVLDEADSFLRDRRGAEHSWEVTQVNELLVQMENFEGVFICSTNLMDDLDQASLRRFALKIRFDYLKPEQAVRMLRQECATQPTETECIQVARLPNLTPGDFAAVKKRQAILGEPFTPGAMIRGLREELESKHCLRESRIGFLAPQEER